MIFLGLGLVGVFPGFCFLRTGNPGIWVYGWGVTFGLALFLGWFWDAMYRFRTWSMLMGKVV